jgi:hypothetical protein
MFNVGDLKTNELPLEFALDYAWNPKRLPAAAIGAWQRHYAEEQFGVEQAETIGDLLASYGKLQSDRKPELLNRKITLDPSKDPTTDTSAVLYSDQSYFATDSSGQLLPPDQRTYYDDNPFSLTNYSEMERVVDEWQTLALRAKTVAELLPAEAKDAYYELVLYNIAATANLYELRAAQFKNILYATQERASTNDFAALAKAHFDADQAMSNYYNTELANGKWSGFQTQPHIGYGDRDRYGSNAGWQQPQLNEQALPDAIFPALSSRAVPAGAAMGVSIDGSESAWPLESGAAVLPTLSSYQTGSPPYIEVFNRGSAAFDYQIAVDAPPGNSNGNAYTLPWIFVTPNAGTIDQETKEVRAVISVDWPHAPQGIASIPITFSVTSNDDQHTVVPVQATLEIPQLADWLPKRFIEAGGAVSIEAAHYSRLVSSGGVSFQLLPDIGRTGAAMTPSPVTAPAQTPGGDSPHLEYDMYLLGAGDVSVSVYLSPRNSVLHNGGLRYGISIDAAPIQTVNVNLGDDLTGGGNRTWERHTSDNCNLTKTTHFVGAAGTHVLKFWMVDPTVIVQKLVVDTGGVRESYFGPPESYRTLE